MDLSKIDFEKIAQTTAEWILTSGLQIIVVLIILLIALKVVRLLTTRLLNLLFRNHVDDIEYQKRANTLKGIVNKTLSVILIGIGLMMILGELGINLGPIIAAAGVVGLAVGFGAQKLVEDVIAGFFILLEDQIRVGDVVQIAGQGGLVEKVDLRMVTLRDLAGNVHYVRNGQIGVVTNMTKEYSRYVFDVGVAYRENVDEVINLIKKVDEDMRQDPKFKDDILEPIEIMGLDKFADSAVVIKARTKTIPIKQWSVGREFNRRLKALFDKNNIEIPFPHRTIYIGQDKKGTSPALFIHNKN